MPLPVLMIVASEDDGGMARVAFLLAKHLPAFGIAVRAAVHREAPFTGWLRGIGVEFDVVPELIETPTRPRADGREGIAALVANLRDVPRAARRIRELARRHGSALLYSHNTWSHYVAAAAARHARPAPSPQPVAVWHIHNDHSRPMTRLLDRAAIRLGGVGAVIAVSRSAGRPFEHVKAPLAVVLNGIDPATTDAARGTPVLRERLGLERDVPVVTYVGRLVSHKGIQVLLEAARLALAKVPEMHVVVLGGAPRHERTNVVEELRARVDAWGLGGHVHLVGHVAEVERWVADADIGVVPSTCAEGCPLSAIEPLSLGVPLVASAIGGLPEIVDDGVDGVLVAPGEAPALADAIVSLARQPDRRRRMARAARDAARDRFDAARMASQVAAVLRAAVPAGRAPA